ncbi:adenine nucleotide alpha hydrolase (plasmid) [Phyllobacterium zundukense]|uniref:Adenine nucleotide alpha hydrolase n=1 Tax=Phyllobacterium zundukense TaxID=1867719 RepID=A0ACD4CYG4_9HYPH|nr:adenine nucleotide alpha hydrolase [Phyllobacterium zundukense]UXN58671.1 adenine nucleotide alpha hydrolase [Phyllobacterium zundukense]
MRKRLEDILVAIGPLTVAVSGGVDSMTLAAAAHLLTGRNGVNMVHAASPAVPPEATQRARDWAGRENWDLQVVDAGEFADANYRSNPVNRCFFCKGNLYGTIARYSSRQIVSGANVDDLGEYRPGLDAARDHGVRHPYVEAGMYKNEVRQLARELGLGDVAELASSPCLASRVETSIRIEPETLGFIHAVETFLAEKLKPRTVRCRVRSTGVVVELDAASLQLLTVADSALLETSIMSFLPPNLAGKSLAFEPYRNGSAFLRTGTS